MFLNADAARIFQAGRSYKPSPFCFTSELSQCDQAARNRHGSLEESGISDGDILHHHGGTNGHALLQCKSCHIDRCCSKGVSKGRIIHVTRIRPSLSFSVKQ